MKKKRLMELYIELLERVEFTGSHNSVELNEYKKACESLGEEVSRLRAEELHNRDLQRECNQLKYELKLHKDALVDERASKAQENGDLIQHINSVRNMVGTYALDREISGETREVLNELARNIDAFDRDKK